MSSHVSSKKLHTSIRATRGNSSIGANASAAAASVKPLSRGPTKQVAKKGWFSSWMAFLLEMWKDFMIHTWWYK